MSPRASSARPAEPPRDQRRGRGVGKAAQGRETRDRLLQVARALFGDRGYAATSTDQILAGARVTRGALYHHFGDKADLMRAVCHQLYGEIDVRIRERADAVSDPWKSLVAGCDAFLDEVADRALVRVLFLDGPAVLGLEEWDAIEREHGFQSLVQGIEAAIKHGALPRRPAEPLAVLLNGALNEVVYWASRQEDPELAVKSARSSFRFLLNALHSAQ